MGYGFPAAIGAQVGLPGAAGHRHRRRRLVPDEHPGAGHRWCSTACRSRSSILNNNFLGMVRQWQQLFFNKRYSQTCMELPIDFVKLAEAYGATGLRAEQAGGSRGGDPGGAGLSGPA
ncbi:MAG: thiamine pyrophosphate-dependent enzyme [Desulfomicrobium escambiense]|nr:thiamine pyrophosphate-dependent enzyme [Desulfomicrobium escambiense]